jgi:histone deacetylase 11
MIIDLDAHQGNGHEKDFGSDGERLCALLFSCTYFVVATISWLIDIYSSLAGRVYTLDMYNSGIYPFVST